MSRLNLALLILLLSSVLYGETLVATHKTRRTKSVPQVQRVIFIKECLSSRNNDRCLTENDLYLVQRILSNYVIAQSQRNYDR